MAFTFLMNGDVLPSVTTSQILLRRHRPQATITADGHFGPRTKGAVEGFQSFHRLTRDGIIGDGSWNQFMSVSNFQTIDVVDGTDPSLVALEATDVRAAGGNPIVVFGMSNGIEVMVSQVTARGRPGNVMLLRIHGHGNRGLQNVSAGEIDGAPHLAAISLSNFSQIEGTIARIRSVMLPFGSIQLLGCDVGGGRGSRLVSRLATTWGVPVTAGLHTQFGGGNRTFRFEGPTVTGFPPGAANLRSWSQLMETRFGNQTMPT